MNTFNGLHLFPIVKAAFKQFAHHKDVDAVQPRTGTIVGADDSTILRIIYSDDPITTTG